VELLAESFAAMRRNAATVLLYTLAVVGFNTAVIGLNVLFDAPLKDEGHANLAHLYTIVTNLFLTVVFSLAQAMAFSKLGADIDRPLWRVSGAGEAIRRFFQLWFILNLFVMAVSYLQAVIPDSPTGEAFASLLLLLSVALIVVCVPMGACVMFRGPITWEEGARSFSPLMHELPRTLLLFFLSAISIVLDVNYHVITESLNQKWLTVLIAPAFAIPSALIECFVFAGTWLICMTHREHGEDTDLDF
jgi:hypothetical protein